MHLDLPTNVVYQASSPGTTNVPQPTPSNSSLIFVDEFALVYAMQQLGVVFFSRTPNSVTINFVSHSSRRFRA